MAGCAASDALDAQKHAFNRVAVAIGEGREAVFPDAIDLWRNVGEGPRSTDLPPDGVAVIACVGIDESGFRHLFEQDSACLAVSDIATCQHEGDGWPQVIG